MGFKRWSHFKGFMNKPFNHFQTHPAMMTSNSSYYICPPAFTSCWQCAYIHTFSFCTTAMQTIIHTPCPLAFPWNSLDIMETWRWQSTNTNGGGCGGRKGLYPQVETNRQSGELVRPICHSVTIKKWCRAAEDCYKDLQLLMDEAVRWSGWRDVSQCTSSALQK